MNTTTVRLLGSPRTKPVAGDAAAVLFVWIVAVSVTLVVAAFTHIGPVVLHITTMHGLHLGDVLTAMILGMVALAVTVVIGAKHVLATRRH